MPLRRPFLRYRLILLTAMFALTGTFVHAADPAIGPGDILKIEVYEEPELSMEVVVSASGDFSYPLLERVEAAGHSTHSLARMMEQMLRDKRFLRFPSVNVTLTKQRNSVVALSGSIGKPGIYPLMPGTRLREFLADYGGIADENAGPVIVIQKTDGTSVRIRHGDLYSENPEIREKNNPVLEAGDEVIIPKSEVFYVSGAVRNPSKFNIDREVTVRDAIATAGGCAVESGNAIFWQRTNAQGKRETVVFDKRQLTEQDPQLLQPVGPGDMIYVAMADTFFVGGYVKAPGEFHYEKDMTLSRAIALAGDRQEFSSAKITIVRENPKGERTIEKYDLKTIRSGKDKDPLIQPGDIITVGGGFLAFSSKVRKLLPISMPWTFLNE
ncbi:MAG TPA: SLBB domain-containing protein [bacterium]|nr:SLBB domain-containing protein [bacterium]HQL62851.1 SLBB domain-containing protein [bacterium]